MKHTTFACLLFFPLALTAMEKAPSANMPIKPPATIKQRVKIMLHIIQRDLDTDTGTVLCAYQAIYKRSDNGKLAFCKDKAWKKVRNGLEQISAQVTSLDFEKNEVAMEISYSIPAKGEAEFKLEWAATAAILPIDGSGYKELPRNNLYLRAAAAFAIPKTIDTGEKKS